jgi:protein TonB
MFEQTFLAGTARTRRAWTVPVCFLGQLVAVGCVALSPLVFFEGLPYARLMPPPLTVPRGPRPVRPPNAVELVATPRNPVSHTLFEPTRTPIGIAQIVDAAPGPPVEEYSPCVDCVIGAPPSLDTVLTAQRPLPPRPVERPSEPVLKPAAKPAAPIRISKGVQEAKLIHRVTPVYPHLAVLTHTTGVVHLSAIIGTDGRIRELQVLDGHPLLVQAALDAVRQWVYQPTMLSGAPVEVVTGITVTFTLNAR